MKNTLELVRILNRLINEVETTNVMDDIDLLTKYAEEIDNLYNNEVLLGIPNHINPFYPINNTICPTNPIYPIAPTTPWKGFDVWYTCNKEI
jgi:hypothetical protein